MLPDERRSGNDYHAGYQSEYGSFCHFVFLRSGDLFRDLSCQESGGFKSYRGAEKKLR